MSVKRRLSRGERPEVQQHLWVGARLEGKCRRVVVSGRRAAQRYRWVKGTRRQTGPVSVPPGIPPTGVARAPRKPTRPQNRAVGCPPAPFRAERNSLSPANPRKARLPPERTAKNLLTLHRPSPTQADASRGSPRPLRHYPHVFANFPSTSDRKMFHDQKGSVCVCKGVRVGGVGRRSVDRSESPIPPVVPPIPADGLLPLVYPACSDPAPGARRPPSLSVLIYAAPFPQAPHFFATFSRIGDRKPFRDRRGSGRVRLSDGPVFPTVA